MSSGRAVVVDAVVDGDVGGCVDLAIEPIVAVKIVFADIVEVLFVTGVVVADVGARCELGALLETEESGAAHTARTDLAGSRPR